MPFLPNYPLRAFLLALAGIGMVSLLAAPRAHAEAKLLIEASTGKVLLSENATYPWYPASVTKLMTTYTTLRAIKEGRVSFNTLLTVSPNALAQQPTKMGFPVGTRVTIDNALKMLLVKSANDMAVVIAEGVGGSVEGFAEMMNADAKRLGMTQSNFVNPNGLPAENHVSSARDLGMLARALITDFPEYDSYWHIHSIRYGRRVIHNYNSLLDRYPGADGMKTGFICASGYNLVASATRNGRRLIAIVLGAYSGATRAQETAQLLEWGFTNSQLSLLAPSLGTVDALTPIAAQPKDLHEQMCGRHRRKPPSEDNDEEEASADNSNDIGDVHVTLSSLKKSGDKFVLGPPTDTTPPVVVFTGPAEHPDPAIEPPASKKKKKKTRIAHTTAGGNDAEQKDKSAETKPSKKKPANTAKKRVKAKLSSNKP